VFICRLCKEGLGVEGLIRSWGSCEMCDRTGTYCFDIPASRLPGPRERLAAEVIEELFVLARERRLLAATHEAEELACHEVELTRAIQAIPTSMLPKIIRELVVMLDEMSHASLRTGGR
jgi:hypothetical protein